jgi:hypothetical protein
VAKIPPAGGSVPPGEGAPPEGGLDVVKMPPAGSWTPLGGEGAPNAPVGGRDVLSREPTRGYGVPKISLAGGLDAI